MKKELLIHTVLIVSFLFSTNIQPLSAQNADNKLELNNDVDSLSYFVGIVQSSGLKDYIVENFNVDTVCMSDFVKGVYTGAQSGSDPSLNAFCAGIQVGHQVSNQIIKGVNYQVFGDDETKSISLELFLTGFFLGMEKSSDDELISMATQKVDILAKRIEKSKITPDYTAYKKKNEEWLVANKTKPGIHTLPSGVQYKIIKQGVGKKPSEDSEVECHYEVRLIDGEIIDSTYERNETSSFSIYHIVEGWAEALQEMPVGSVWEIYIPQELGYGNKNIGSLKPYSTLIIKTELISIKQ